MPEKLPANVDWEIEYNNRNRVPEHPEIIASWASQAQEYRGQNTGECDLRYGPSERNRVDLFYPTEKKRIPAGIHLFIHGGYWQAMDKTNFSHIARGLNERGHIVAIPSYTLCPETSIAHITDEIRLCAAYLWRRFERNLTVSGHSAGGHLAAEMMATDWAAWSPDLPAGMVSKAVAVSGLFDLRPLVHTTINSSLRLDEESALAASPAFRTPPEVAGLQTVVGENESSEFHRQCRIIVENWGGSHVAGHDVVPGTNHFTVLEPYQDGNSSLVAACI